MEVSPAVVNRRGEVIVGPACRRALIAALNEAEQDFEQRVHVRVRIPDVTNRVRRQRDDRCNLRQIPEIIASRQHVGPTVRIWRERMRRYLPYFLISAVLTAAVLTGIRLYRQHQTRSTVSRQLPAAGKPGAEPPHVRGVATAQVTLEEFGDFECMPCLLLWPALRNLEQDYGERLAVIFRQHPLAQHQHAAKAARAAEAAGLQGRFWEMHDLLYLKRSTWTGASDPSAAFQNLAAELGLDVDKFGKDIDSAAVAERIKADEDRGESLGIDRTPIVFINGKRVELLPDVEKGLRAEIDAALKNSTGSAN
jgi:protein-disulfide isomerase